MELRQALRASGVALVKSWVLWTGVTLGTRFTRLGRWSGAAMIAWVAAALAGTGLLVYGLTGHWQWTVVALAAPVPLAFLWEAQWPAGLIAGYAFWPVFFGSVPGILACQVYRGVEWVAELVGERLPGTRDVDLPAPDTFSRR